VMARRIKQVPAVCRVDIEEDTRNDNSLLLEKFFKECLMMIFEYVQSELNTRKSARGNGAHQTVVERRGQLFEVKPDVESARRRNIDIEMKFLKTRKDVITLSLEVFLESNLWFYIRVNGMLGRMRIFLSLAFSCWT